MDWRFILSLIFSIFVAIFAIFNAETVKINFLFTKVEISQALVILISTALGAIIVLFMSFFRQLKLKKRIKALEKQLVSHKGEMEKLGTELDAIRSTEQDITDEQIFSSDENVKE